MRRRRHDHDGRISRRSRWWERDSAAAHETAERPVAQSRHLRQSASLLWPRPWSSSVGLAEKQDGRVCCTAVPTRPDGREQLAGRSNRCNMTLDLDLATTLSWRAPWLANPCVPTFSPSCPTTRGRGRWDARATPRSGHQTWIASPAREFGLRTSSAPRLFARLHAHHSSPA